MNRAYQLSQTFWVLLIGLGIGWLTGLSVSAVVGTVIASLLSIGAGMVTGLKVVGSTSNDQESKSTKYNFDARPAAMLVLGIALAAPLGIIARTHHLFEPPGYTTTENVKQSIAVNEPNSFGRSAFYSGVLFGVQQEECDQVLSFASMGHYNLFIEQLEKSNIPCSKSILEKFRDNPKTLAVVVETICNCNVPK